jgi:hypothetical protein
MFTQVLLACVYEGNRANEVFPNCPTRAEKFQPVDKEVDKAGDLGPKMILARE